MLRLAKSSVTKALSHRSPGTAASLRRNCVSVRALIFVLEN